MAFYMVFLLQLIAYPNYILLIQKTQVGPFFDLAFLFLSAVSCPNAGLSHLIRLAFCHSKRPMYRICGLRLAP